MYSSEPILPYADGLFSIMPSGLPERFYPEENSRKYVTKDYVICFNEDVSGEIKQRIIKDYAEVRKNNIENGYY